MIHVDIERDVSSDGTSCMKVIWYHVPGNTWDWPACAGFGFYALKNGRWEDIVRRI